MKSACRERRDRISSYRRAKPAWGFCAWAQRVARRASDGHRHAREQEERLGVTKTLAPASRPIRTAMSRGRSVTGRVMIPFDGRFGPRLGCSQMRKGDPPISPRRGGAAGRVASALLLPRDAWSASALLDPGKQEMHGGRVLGSGCAAVSAAL